MLAAGYTYPIVAGTAVDRAVVLRQKRNLRLDSALGAYNSMHLARSAIGTSTCAAFRTATRATTWTTARLINQALLLVKLLLTGSECEIVSTLPAFEGFVNEAQTRDLLVIKMVFFQAHILAESPAVCHL